MMIYLSRDTWMALQDMSSADVADAICDSQAIVEAIQSDAWSDVADIVRARVELKAKRIAQGVMEPETLYWHAFNYRQVHTTQAHEMWEKLEQFVDSKIKTPQRTWVELTDEQINAIGEKMFGRFGYEGKSDRKFARYIEAKLKEKNT
jgi:hypothetical protein